MGPFTDASSPVAAGLFDLRLCEPACVFVSVRLCSQLAICAPYYEKEHMSAELWPPLITVERSDEIFLRGNSSVLRLSMKLIIQVAERRGKIQAAWTKIPNRSYAMEMCEKSHINNLCCFKPLPQMTVSSDAAQERIYLIFH